MEHWQPSNDRRQFVKYSFFKVDSAWRRLPKEEKDEGRDGLMRLIEEFARILSDVRTYSLVGIRGDTDFLVWLVADRLEDVQEFGARMNSTYMGAYLHSPYSYLAMTGKSQYIGEHRHKGQESMRLKIKIVGSKYVFVYPFTKKREWYGLSLEERQKMMGEHFRIGHEHPSVTIHTTYSFGLDDQEFMLAFETDHPSDFLELVMELRSSSASRYTQLETPVFTCVYVSPAEMVQKL